MQGRGGAGHGFHTTEHVRLVTFTHGWLPVKSTMLYLRNFLHFRFFMCLRNICNILYFRHFCVWKSVLIVEPTTNIFILVFCILTISYFLFEKHCILYFRHFIFCVWEKCSWLSDQPPTFNFLTVLLGDTLTLMSGTKFGDIFLEIYFNCTTLFKYISIFCYS